MKKPRLVNILLLFFSCGIVFIFFEAALHLFFPCLLAKIYLRPAYLHCVFEPNPEVMPGVSGNSKFMLNSCGIRADELSSKFTKRILVVGGSTAECLYLDQTEAWPYLLQKNLNQKLGENDLWVGNTGIAGKNSQDHAILLMNFPLKKLRINLVVVLAGINDLNVRLSLGQDYLSAYSDKKKDLGFFKKIFIWRLAREIQQKKTVNTEWKVQDVKGEIYKTWRANRRLAKKIITELPDLSSALKVYDTNINTMIDIAKENNTRIIFVTQPTLWKAGLSLELRDLLWVGGIGDYQSKPGCEYYSVEALAAGMKMYNDRLMAVCKSRNVECIDLASFLAKDTSVFYDDCHFNENGAVQVSDILSQYILKTHIFDKL